jgi:hypothetical protein
MFGEVLSIRRKARGSGVRRGAAAAIRTVTALSLYNHRLRRKSETSQNGRRLWLTESAPVRHAVRRADGRCSRQVAARMLSRIQEAKIITTGELKQSIRHSGASKAGKW